MPDLARDWASFHCFLRHKDYRFAFATGLQVSANAARNPFANLVGYTTQNYKGGKWLICATPFESVGGTPVNLQDAVKGFVTTTATVDSRGNMVKNNPNVQIQDRSKTGAVSGGTTTYFWCADAIYDEEHGVTKPGWADEDGYYLGGIDNDEEVILDPGTAFWFKDPANGVQMQLTLAGQVLAGSTKDLTPTMNKWNLICNPYPIELALNSDKIAWTGITAATVDNRANMVKNNPNIQIQDRDKNGNVSGGTTTYFWCQDAVYDEEHSITKPGWADEDGYYLGGVDNDENVSIPVGAGFWFKDPTSSVTIQWTK